MPALRRALKQGAEVDAVDCSGFTALHLAAEKGHSDIVDELLAQVSSLQRSLS
jgi:ankyrin repeat protein